MTHPSSIASNRNVTDVALSIEIGSFLPPLPIHLHSRQATQKFIICGMPSSRTLPFSPHSHFLLNVCFRIQCASTQSCNIQLHCFLGVYIFIAQERSESFSYLQRVPLHLGAPQCGAFRAVSDSFRAEKTGKGKVANNKPHQHCYLSMVGFDLHCFDQT